MRASLHGLTSPPTAPHADDVLDLKIANKFEKLSVGTESNIFFGKSSKVNLVTTSVRKHAPSMQRCLARAPYKRLAQRHQHLATRPSSHRRFRVSRAAETAAEVETTVLGADTVGKQPWGAHIDTSNASTPPSSCASDVLPRTRPPDVVQEQALRAWQDTNVLILCRQCASPVRSGTPWFSAKRTDLICVTSVAPHPAAVLPSTASAQRLATCISREKFSQKSVKQSKALLNAAGPQVPLDSTL
ncbi:hypothetical protein B0H14DRAFT_3894406 [Mycena olivaceomarginata]|nr:hypothetical protein B0H14DRAFT_3894406 [Mycena olivaceomarginata]